MRVGAPVEHGGLSRNRQMTIVTNQFISLETLPSEILRALRALAVKRHLENSKRSKNLKKDMSTYH